ncbi:hypothetical protein ACIB24_03525 [Spongisporangium articulatum]|uniref:Uncharacterized protein n=1 Tax=Spongisporangium articulatum TaxID=3362603 RepID=A0ABW8AID8_9ACTN
MRVSQRIVRLMLAGTAVAALLTTALAAPSQAATACPSGLLAFQATLSNGTFNIGKNVKTTGGGANICGEITVGAGGLVPKVDPNNISFTSGKTSAGPLSIPTDVKTVGDMTGTTTINPDGTISASFTTSVVVTTKILGQSCQIPVNLTLTTGRSGSLSGKPLSYDLATGVSKGKLVAGDFTVPKIKTTKQCNVIVATASNALIGLPLAAGKSSISYDIALKLGV